MEQVKLLLPEDLLIEVNEILTLRGSDLQTYVRLQLRALVTSTKHLLNLNSTMLIGKYRGESVESIVRADPSYIAWMASTSTHIQFETEVLILIEELNTLNRSNILAIQPKKTRRKIS